MMWNLQLSNNSFERKNVTFYGVKTYSDPSYIFQGVSTPNPTIYAPPWTRYGTQTGSKNKAGFPHGNEDASYCSAAIAIQRLHRPERIFQQLLTNPIHTTMMWLRYYPTSSIGTDGDGSEIRGDRCNLSPCSSWPKHVTSYICVACVCCASNLNTSSQRVPLQYEENKK